MLSLYSLRYNSKATETISFSVGTFFELNIRKIYDLLRRNFSLYKIIGKSHREQRINT